MLPTQRNDLAITVYAPGLVDNDDRPLAVVRAMERASPGLRLEWTISDEGKLVPLPERDAWIAQGRANEPGFPLICNGGDENNLVTISGWVGPARLSPGGQPQFEVHADLPLDAAHVASAADVLEAVAESTRAFWGHATPFNPTVEISRQIRHPVHKPGVPPRGLPALKLREELRLPETPHRLGWLNYWSPAAARAIGFPDPTRDADLLACSRRTAMGGWLVRLTDAPLDLDVPTHLDALSRAYERFPTIGGRDTPR